MSANECCGAYNDHHYEHCWTISNARILIAADALAKAAKPFANYEHLGYYDDIICKLSCTCGTDLEWDQKHESDCEAVAFISALAAYEKARKGSDHE